MNNFDSQRETLRKAVMYEHKIGVHCSFSVDLSYCTVDFMGLLIFNLLSFPISIIFVFLNLFYLVPTRVIWICVRSAYSACYMYRAYCVSGLQKKKKKTKVILNIYYNIKRLLFSLGFFCE